MARRGLSRRSFVGSLAALGALATMSGCAPKARVSETAAGAAAGKPGELPSDMEVRHAWCQMCGPARTFCSTLCYIDKDGRWAHVEGNPAAGNSWGPGSKSLCAKGQAAMQTVYDPSRILYPMKNVGKKGEGKFERCTIEEAIKATADKLKQIKEEDGPERLGVLSPQNWAPTANLGRRFMNVYGTPNYMHSAICHMQRTTSKNICIGAATATEPRQLDKTALFVLWGANPENSQVNQGLNYRIVNNMERGMTVVDIRPMMDQLTSKADVWLPVRPGTDCALGLAILHVIIGEDLYDHDFVENWCSGFDKLAAHVTEFTPEWASEITGLSADQIRSTARMMGTVKPMGIMYGNGVGDQQNDGNSTVLCISLIMAITGNLDVPGGGGAAKPAGKPAIATKPIGKLEDRLPKTPEDEKLGFGPSVSKLVAPEFPRWFQTKTTKTPTSAYFKALMSTITKEPYALRAVIGQGSNPFGATRQPKTIKDALEKLEFYVVVDTHWNSSCDYADYVIPACTQYECSQQFGTKNSPKGTFIGMNQQIVEPLGESISDWDFYLKLAMEMGYGEDFWNGDMDMCLREQLEGSGIALEDLRAANKGIFVEKAAGGSAPEPSYQNYGKLFEKLPGGKVQCYNELIGGKPNALETGELSYLPIYIGPPESKTNTPELAEEFPLILSDVHAYRLCEHSYFVGLPYLRELQPYPWVRINPATAKSHGIADGDWVRIESPHGWIKLVAEYFEGLPPDVLMCRRGWWQSCEELDLPGYGCFDGGSDSSLLYDSDPANFDAFHSAMAKQTLVKISKAEGAE